MTCLHPHSSAVWWIAAATIALASLPTAVAQPVNPAAPPPPPAPESAPEAATPPPPDEVILTNGSVIRGELVEVAAGKLKIKTDFAGELTIELAKVRGITTAKPLTVQFESGDRVVGQLEHDAAEGQQVTGELVGRRPVVVADVRSAWGQGGESPELRASREAYEKAKAKWETRIELGINGQTGNQEHLNIFGRAQTKRTTPDDRLMIYAQGRYARQNGDDVVREVLGGLSLEVDLSERMYAYGRLELENDKFEQIDLRATVTGGLGYFIIQKPDHEWKVRAGAGLQYEAYTDEAMRDDMAEAIGELGHDYFVDINDWLRYTHSLTVFVPFDDPEGWRGVMENAGELPLDKDKQWKLRLGLRHQYDAKPADDVERLDTYYFLNLVLDLK